MDLTVTRSDHTDVAALDALLQEPPKRTEVEQTFGKLKRFKRVALRGEKIKTGFSAFVSLALAFILIKSVHTT